VITRFAPSPTGPLHLGHAYSALTVWRVAQDMGGIALLRIEDTDSTRCRPAFEAAIHDDLRWLGLSWPEPVRRQSDHLDEYAVALGSLERLGLLYPCSCTRRQITEAGAHPGWDGLVYPGTCRGRAMKSARPGDAIRLDLRAALDHAGPLPAFDEIGPLHKGHHRPDPAQLIEKIGDPVLRRKETGDPAYHLACLHDDAAQDITHVVRGADLWHATFLHVVIQTVMGWPVPVYHHHDLIRDDAGTRLAKIARSRAIASYRADGITPSEVRRWLGL